MAKDKVKFGLMGIGMIIRDYHIPVLKQIPRAEITAIAETFDIDGMNALAKEHNIPKTYDNFDDLAGDKDIDAVIIGLPNFLHASVTLQMLKDDKHVLCEKPMAMNLNEAEQMVKAAKNSQYKLMIGHMWRYHWEMFWLRDAVRAGTLGRVYKIKAYHVIINDGPKLDSWSVNPKHSGSGCISDMAVHPFDTISFLLDDKALPQKVFAHGGSYHYDLKVPDTAQVIIEYDNGVTATVESGWYHKFASGPEGALEVFGTKGYARVFPRIFDFKDHASDLPTEMYYEKDGLWINEKPNTPAAKGRIDLPLYIDQNNHFIDCILENIQPIPGAHLGLRTIRIIDAAERSIKSGRCSNL